MDVKDTVCSFRNLYNGMRKCKQGVMWKGSTIRYVSNGLANITDLHLSHYNGKYKLSAQGKFTIHEPKVREIEHMGLKDRIFQRSLCDNYVYDKITNDFIYDNSACQKDRGTDHSRHRMKVHLMKHYRKYGTRGYILRCDIKNYFGDTLHSVAKEATAKRIPNEWALNHVHNMIESYDKGDEKGIGLGSQLSQLIQLAVLSDLDHTNKELFKIKQYIRYMDDFILVHHSKEFLQNCLEAISIILKDLGLGLNKKKTQLFPATQRFTYLGFTYQLTGSGKILMIPCKKNVKKRKKIIHRHISLVIQGRMTKAQADQSFESWLSHTAKGTSRKLLFDMVDYYNKAWLESGLRVNYFARAKDKKQEVSVA